MEFLEELKKEQEKIRKEMAEARERLTEISKNGLSKICKDIFDESPRLTSFSWSQYTPYFNDGEECTFSCNYDYFDINGYDEYGDDESDEEKGPNIAKNVDYKYKGEWRDPNRKKIYSPKGDAPEASKDCETIQQVYDLLNSFSDDDYKAMFGDHVKVIVTRAGVHTEEYDHD